MRNIFLIMLVFVLNHLGMVVCDGEDIMDTKQKALKIVGDSASSSAEFNVAMKQLDKVKGEATFWLKIAADGHFSADRRCQVVKHFFDQFVKSGMSLAEIVKLTGTNANWISYEQVRKYGHGELGGWLPEALMQGKCGFSIPILSKESVDYHLVILISFETDLEQADLLNILQGRINQNLPTNSIAAACSTWDSNDQEKVYPGSKSRPWPW